MHYRLSVPLVISKKPLLIIIKHAWCNALQLAFAFVLWRTDIPHLSDIHICKKLETNKSELQNKLHNGALKKNFFKWALLLFWKKTELQFLYIVKLYCWTWWKPMHISCWLNQLNGWRSEPPLLKLILSNW